jgi:hypothetical protein
MSWDTFNFAIRSAITWFFRARKPESWIFRGAVAVLLVINGPNWFIKYSRNTQENPLNFEIGATGSGSDFVFTTLTLICCTLMIGSAFWAWNRYKSDNKLFSQRTVLVIEGRGLRDDDGSSLLSAVPKNIIGQRTGYLLDLRQRKDGIIVEPEDLLPATYSMKTWFHQIQKGSNRDHLTTVYGGLTAVPLTFLTGILLDDEGEIIVMDWDRIESQWRMLDGSDDGLRFEISGLEKAKGHSEVVLAISASYKVKSEDLATTFAYPVIYMEIPNLQSSHWSTSKQSALSDQFFTVLKQLDSIGVERIHLVLAAQNSLVFNLSRRYDKRNLPKLIVYQFERGQTPKYPWGIEMPVAGQVEPRIVRELRE